MLEGDRRILTCTFVLFRVAVDGMEPCGAERGLVEGGEESIYVHLGRQKFG